MIAESINLSFLFSFCRVLFESAEKLAAVSAVREYENEQREDSQMERMTLLQDVIFDAGRLCAAPVSLARRTLAHGLLTSPHPNLQAVDSPKVLVLAFLFVSLKWVQSELIIHCPAWWHNDIAKRLPAVCIVSPAASQA